MINSSRNFYSKNMMSNVYIPRSNYHNPQKIQTNRKKLNSQKSYTNVYRSSAQKFQYKTTNNFYNGRQNLAKNRMQYDSRTTNQVSIDKHDTESTTKFPDTSFSTRRESQNSRNGSTKMRSFSKLNQAEPKSFMDTLRRQTPFQRTQSASRNFVSKVVSSNRTSIGELSLKEDEENDRIQGNTFISIPKVKTGLNQKAHKKNPKNQLKRKKNNLQNKLKKMAYTPKVRVNPILLNKNIQTSKKIINQNINRDKQHLKKNQQNHFYKTTNEDYVKHYSDTKKNINISNLFQNQNINLNKNFQLKQDIFSNTTRDESTFVPTPTKESVHGRGSRLQNYIDIKSRSVSQINQIKNQTVSIDLSSEMCFKTNKESQPSLFSSKSVPKKLVSKKAFNISKNDVENKKSESTLYMNKNFGVINSQKVSEELNHFLKYSNQSEIKDTIMGKNKHLKELTKEYKELNKTSTNTLKSKIESKQKLLNNKKNILSTILKNLKVSGKMEQSSPYQKQRRVSFEKSLSPGTLKKRQKLRKKLKKLDKRCSDLNQQLSEYSKGVLWMEENTKINQKFLVTETNNLTELLRNDSQDKILKTEMMKMIKTLELLS